MLTKPTALLALVFLCGVGQAGERVTVGPPFIGRLPEVTVELVGVTYFPPTNRSRWWLPDGSPAPLGPFRPYKITGQWRKLAGAKKITFLVRFKYLPGEKDQYIPDPLWLPKYVPTEPKYVPTEQPSDGQGENDQYEPDTSSPFEYVPPDGQGEKEQSTPDGSWPPWGINGNVPHVRSWEGHDVVDAHGNGVPDSRMFSAVLGPYAQTVDFRPGVAVGAWETVITRKLDSAGRSNFTRDGRESTWTFRTFHKRGSAGTTRVVMPLQWLEFYGKRDIRLVAVGGDGSERASPISYVSGKKTATAVFHGLPLSSIKELRFQVRRYGWVEFKNVSLRPGHKTVVKVASWVDPVNTER